MSATGTKTNAKKWIKWILIIVAIGVVIFVINRACSNCLGNIIGRGGDGGGGGSDGGTSDSGGMGMAIPILIIGVIIILIVKHKRKKKKEEESAQRGAGEGGASDESEEDEEEGGGDDEEEEIKKRIITKKWAGASDKEIKKEIKKVVDAIDENKSDPKKGLSPEMGCYYLKAIRSKTENPKLKEELTKIINEKEREIKKSTKKRQKEKEKSKNIKKMVKRGEENKEAKQYLKTMQQQREELRKIDKLAELSAIIPHDKKQENLIKTEELFMEMTETFKKLKKLQFNTLTNNGKRIIEDTEKIVETIREKLK